MTCGNTNFVFVSHWISGVAHGSSWALFVCLFICLFVWWLVFIALPFCSLSCQYLNYSMFCMCARANDAINYAQNVCAVTIGGTVLKSGVMGSCLFISTINLKSCDWIGLKKFVKLEGLLRIALITQWLARLFFPLRLILNAVFWNESSQNKQEASAARLVVQKYNTPIIFLK